MEPMPLSIGDKLGPYEILGPLGAGGMGEVYRARDTQLDREVAVKVLPRALAGDPERLARFDREAKILAALHHPNIAVIHGLEQFDGGRALVMELVPGETLAERMKHGVLPAEEACKVAVQMAEALEAAHEKGIVHRDLKPGNVMITPDRVVKVLDFGLAAVSAPVTAPGEAHNSPTVTMGMTQAGTIMGTAAYMSPEQAAGQHVDKRSDIWSFGVVLWELLTGKRLFGGETISHTLADVLRAPIDVAALNAPAPLKKLLRRCLDRDAKTRLRDVGEARVAIREYLANPTSGAEVPRAPEGRSSQTRIAWGVAAAALLVVAILGWRAMSGPAEATDRPLIRLSVDLGKDAERDSGISAILSPDGTRIVYTARAPGGLRQLYTRRLDQPTATLLASTMNRNFLPSFSPDGRWVSFWDFGNRLVKTPAEGGEPIVLGVTSPDVRQGADWVDDDTIIVNGENALMLVPASGGAPEPVPGTNTNGRFPQVLPGSRAVLVSSGTPSGRILDLFDIDVVTLATGEKKNLVHGGYWAHYLPTSGEVGHLVFIRDGTLFGVGFDPRSLELMGTPTPLLNDIAANSDLASGGGQIAFSRNGTAVYLSGKTQGATYPISTLDASGNVTTLISKAGAYGSPRWSPDGKQVAYTAESSNGFDLWVYDIARATPRQLTFAGEVVNEVAWAPDSKHLAYQDGKSIWWISSGGGGQPQMLLDGTKSGPELQGPRPFSFAAGNGSGARLAFSPAPGGLPDIWTLPLDLADPARPKPGEPERFLADPNLVEVDPAFSPDSKFVAYRSFETGGDGNIFVRPFPGPGGRWRVSTGGGAFPAWSPATHEIFYLGTDDHIWVTSYTIDGDSFSAGVARVWSPTAVRRNSVQVSFDVSPDGKHVVMFPQPVGEESSGNLHATFLLNFFDEVRRRIPLGK